MKVTFTKDHQSQLSGNSFYAAGIKADFPNGEGLVALGVAYAGWDSQPPMQETEAPPAEGLSPIIERPFDIDPGVDDLTVIKGVGPQTARALNEAGIYRYSELLEWDAAELNTRLDGVLNFITISKIQGWQKAAGSLV